MVDGPSLQRQLRRRLLTWIGGLWLASSLATLGGLWYETTEVLDSALEETAQALMTIPVAPSTLPAVAPPGFDPHEEHVIYQVFDAAGHLLMVSHGAPNAAMDTSPLDGVRSVGKWRVLTLNRVDGQRRVLVAETREHRWEVLWASAGWLLLALVMMLPMAALVIRLVLTRAFAALEPSRQELARRLPHDLRPLNEHALPGELQPWVDTVNVLMTRVRNMVEAERAFAAQMAHELRTPLAAARAQAQRLTLAANLAPPHHDQALALVRQLDRIARLATRLLQLARIEAGVALQRAPLNLVELTTMVADEFGDAMRSGRLRLELPPQPVRFNGDIDALGIALRNLIDNALKHAGPSAITRVRVEPGALSVIDDGPGVPVDRLASLGQKFERSTASVEGSGLGLAMVRMVASQSGMWLDLQSPVADGHGFMATLRIGTGPGLD